MRKVSKGELETVQEADPIVLNSNENKKPSITTPEMIAFTRRLIATSFRSR
jgi:hypothetical protein